MVNDLQLKGNELIIFAIIYGFSQDSDSVFNGSLQYLASWTNSTKRGVIKNLKSLLEKDYIVKNEIVKNGVKYCNYSVKTTTVYNMSQSSQVVNKVHQGSEQSSPNNIEYKESNISINTPITNQDNTNITKERKKSNKLSIEEGLEIAREIFEKNKVEDIEGFMTLTKVWLTYKKQKNQHYVPIGLKRILLNFLKISNKDYDTASEIVDRSITSCYSGLYELNKSNGYYVERLD